MTTHLRSRPLQGRATLGVAAALVGLRIASHVRDNLALSLRVPLSADRIAAFSR